MNNQVKYYLVIDPTTRNIVKRAKRTHIPLDRDSSYWAVVSRSIWKQYRAGDIVSPGDLSGYDLQRLANW